MEVMKVIVDGIFTAVSYVLNALWEVIVFIAKTIWYIIVKICVAIWPYIKPVLIYLSIGIGSILGIVLVIFIGYHLISCLIKNADKCSRCWDNCCNGCCKGLGSCFSSLGRAIGKCFSCLGNSIGDCFSFIHSKCFCSRKERPAVASRPNSPQPTVIEIPPQFIIQPEVRTLIISAQPTLQSRIPAQNIIPATVQVQTPTISAQIAQPIIQSPRTVIQAQGLSAATHRPSFESLRVPPVQIIRPTAEQGERSSNTVYNRPSPSEAPRTSARANTSYNQVPQRDQDYMEPRTNNNRRNFNSDNHQPHPTRGKNYYKNHRRNEKRRRQQYDSQEYSRQANVHGQERAPINNSDQNYNQRSNRHQNQSNNQRRRGNNRGQTDNWRSRNNSQQNHPNSVQTPAPPVAPVVVQTDDTSGFCVICMDERSTYVIIPCAHLCLCDTCVDRFNHSDVGQNCPVCRGEIERVMRIYN